MIYAMGWLVMAFGGAWLAAGLGFLIGARGGLETIASGLFLGAIFAVAWVTLVFWLSPATIGFAL